MQTIFVFFSQLELLHDFHFLLINFQFQGFYPMALRVYLFLQKKKNVIFFEVKKKNYFKIFAKFLNYRNRNNF